MTISLVLACIVVQPDSYLDMLECSPSKKETRGRIRADENKGERQLFEFTGNLLMKHTMLTQFNINVNPTSLRFLLYFSTNYRDLSVKSILIISMFQTVQLSSLISLFLKKVLHEIVSFILLLKD